MAVLMNKGSDPHQATWLFYTERTTMDELSALAVEQRFDSGALTVDQADLDAARKASTQVPVYLAVATLVPEDFDLEGMIAGAEDEAETQDPAEEESDVAEEEQTVPETSENSPAASPGTPAGDGADTLEDMAALDPEPELPYDPVPAPEGIRMLIGTTTAAAARDYIQPREIGGEPWAIELPGIPMLVSLIDHLREHGGLPAFSVWHIDEQGILRMAPAKQIKPAAGNVLRCKL